MKSVYFKMILIIYYNNIKELKKRSSSFNKKMKKTIKKTIKII